MASTRQGVSIRDRRGERLLKDLFRGRSQLLVYHFMFGPDYMQGVRPARRSRTGSTAPLFIWRIMTSCLRRCRGRRSRSCRRTSGLSAGRSPGVVVRQRLQLRLQRRGYRGAAARGECRIQLPARRPPCCLVAPPRRVRQGLSGCGSRYATAAPGLPLCPRETAARRRTCVTERSNGSASPARSLVLRRRTGLRVSELALGCGMFGTSFGYGAQAAEARRIFDGYVEAGGKFLDTADAYQLGASTPIG